MVKNHRFSTFSRLGSGFIGLVLAIVLAVPPTAFAGDLGGISAGSVSTGDTAKAVPSVKTMCGAIDSSLNGDFAKKGFMSVKPECESKSLRQRMTSACQTDRSAELANLTGDARQAKLDEFCAGGATSLTGDNATYCAIRNAAKGGQAKQYCEAYREADKATQGILITTTLDVAAAGICWAEAMTMKDLRTKLGNAKDKQQAALKACADALIADKTNPNPPACAKDKTKLPFEAQKVMGPGSIFNESICGGAAMAAGLGELVQTARMFSGNHLAGDSRIDAGNNVQDRGALLKTVSAVAGGLLSLKGIQLGICYYAKGKRGADGIVAPPGLCANINDADALVGANRSVSELNRNIANVKQAAKLDQDRANADRNNSLGMSNDDLSSRGSVVDSPNGGKTFVQAGTDSVGTTQDAERQVDKTGNVNKAVQGITALNNTQTSTNAIDPRRIAEYRKNISDIGAAFAARANLAHQSAFIFSALTAIRGASLLAANGTKTKAEGILQTMFQGGNGTLSMGAATGGGGSTGIFASPGTSSFAATAGTQAVKSSAMAAGSPESFLLRPGSPTANIAEQLGSQIPAKKLEDAATAGASGRGGLVASVASGLGARDTTEIHGAMASMFANLPKDDGAGYTGGGGKSLAKSGGDTGGDLNLKSLFGGGDKEEHAGAAAPGLSFRGPASDDIWHSQNPKGNNLFQIVSDRYDNTIRRQDLNP